MKQHVKVFLTKKGLKWEDVGVYQDKTKSDYPDFASEVAKKTVKNKAKGILLCGNAVGMVVAANKIKGARATMAYDKFTAEGSVQDDDTNILCLRGLKTTPKQQLDVLDMWLNAKFKGLPRYKRRVEKVKKLEG
tara:strand:- start:2721 stop:3122 length:402 start_codon:yes stop_codon:yes gene_type:complete